MRPTFQRQKPGGFRRSLIRSTRDRREQTMAMVASTDVPSGSKVISEDHQLG
jgi:hypothetical protein